MEREEEEGDQRDGRTDSAMDQFCDRPLCFFAPSPSSPSLSLPLYSPLSLFSSFSIQTASLARISRSAIYAHTVRSLGGRGKKEGEVGCRWMQEWSDADGGGELEVGRGSFLSNIE